MKKKLTRLQWILVSMLLAVAVASSVFLGFWTQMVTFASEPITGGNVGNIGPIQKGAVVTQAFETDEDFYGVALLMGTFATTQIGTIEAELVNLDTGETIWTRQCFTGKIQDNQYFPFATEKKISVDGTTHFALNLYGGRVFRANGPTVWSTAEGDYPAGTLTVNGRESKSSLCMALVKEYRAQIVMGLFSKRLMLVWILAAFLLLHVLFPMEALYEQMHKRRVWIALVFFVFCVANCFHFSSMQQYDTYIQQGQGSEYITPVFGKSRAIRSDEWLVSLPREFAAYYEDYGPSNSIVRATETSALSATGLYRSYSMLAKPQTWGYYLFGAEYGLSFQWCFRMIFGFLFSYELCLIVTRKQKALSLLGAVILWFSAYNMWWSTVTWLIAGQAAIVFFYYFLEEEKLWKRALYGCGIAIFGANFCVDLYPAWQVPAGYVFLMLLIWIFVDHRRSWSAYKAKDWGLVAGCIAFMVSIIGVFMYQYQDYMTATMNTVYPGSRVMYGGYTIYRLKGYLSAVLAPVISFENRSEMGCFYSLFPLSAILYVYVLIRKKGKSLLMWLLMIPGTLLFLYCYKPLPEKLVTYTLLGFSTPGRASDILGYLNVLMLLIALSEIWRMPKPEKKWVLWVRYAVVTAVCAWSCWSAVQCSYRLDSKKIFALTFLLAGATCVAEICMICGTKKLTRYLPVAGLSVMILGSALLVNPLMCKADVITSKPFAKEVSRLVEEDPSAKWIGLDSIIFGDYLIALGAPTYNSTNYVPNMELWKILDPTGENDIFYNRYAHIMVSLVEEETHYELPQADYLHLYLSYGDLEKLDVDYLVSDHAVSGTDAVGLMQVYNEYGMYIYKLAQ